MGGPIEHAAGEAAGKLADNLGKGLEALEVFVTLVVMALVGLIWYAFVRWRRDPGLRPLALAGVLFAHLAPPIYTLFHARPANSYGVMDLWNPWGKALLWSVPGAVVLAWALALLARDLRARWAVRGLVALLWLGLAAALAFTGRPLSLTAPLVEIAQSSELACGQTQRGDVYYLGESRHGQLGNLEPLTLHRPMRIDALAPAQKLFIQPQAVCSLVSPTAVRCLGTWMGTRGRRWEATSRTPVDKLYATTERLYFVAADGAIEAWSEAGAGPVTTRSTTSLLCGERIFYRGA